jgi:hypothetical protein
MSICTLPKYYLLDHISVGLNVYDLRSVGLFVCGGWRCVHTYDTITLIFLSLKTFDPGGGGATTACHTIFHKKAIRQMEVAKVCSKT